MLNSNGELNDSYNGFKAHPTDDFFTGENEGFTFNVDQYLALGATENVVFNNNFSVLGWINSDISVITADK